ncbi:MAG: RibD family protein [Geminicoccaceae bacterium]|nr:RibD family protein [Geminicoccaceae bacterium]MDW8124932.1 RibD family protein [Geminicoccaceae bacterium]MDW8340980.1 RibD family protein [Geminicoccaceae bacterium]
MKSVGRTWAADERPRARWLARAWERLLACAHQGGDLATVPLDGLGPEQQRLFATYRDFLAPSPDGLRVVAHLGQSLDGRIATERGHSAFVTGPEDFVHMHRLRALADAVLVGAGTVALDDPLLTVRFVPGPSPLRVVLDPDRRLGPDRRLFQKSGPPTLVLCRAERKDRETLGAAEVIGLPAPEGRLEPRTVLSVLRARGVRRLFVEGGGTTVSRFLAAGCLDALHLCVAPVIIGSGRAALALPAISRMDEAMRLAPEPIRLGEDWLFYCRLRRAPLAARQTQEIEVADASP